MSRKVRWKFGKLQIRLYNWIFFCLCVYIYGFVPFIFCLFHSQSLLSLTERLRSSHTHHTARALFDGKLLLRSHRRPRRHWRHRRRFPQSCRRSKRRRRALPQVSRPPRSLLSDRGSFFCFLSSFSACFIHALIFSLAFSYERDFTLQLPLVVLQLSFSASGLGDRDVLFKVRSVG